MKKILIIILVILGFFLLLIYFPIGIGKTGIRPPSHGCLGVMVSRTIVHRVLPDAYFERGPFVYYVDRERMNERAETYCLGRDIWYGE